MTTPTTRLILSPHDDDQVLFAGFISMSPTECCRTIVMIVFDSYIQPARGYSNCDAWTRRGESGRASEFIRVDGILRASLRDDVDYTPREVAILDALDTPFMPRDKPITEVYAPLWEENGHEQHNLVSEAAYRCFPSTTIRHYTTYTRTGGRTRKGNPVPVTPEMIVRKHQALACFRSQMQAVTGCQEWFIGDLTEYIA